MRDTFLSRLCGLIGGAIVGWWVGSPVLVHIFVYSLGLDVLTGICRAAAHGKVSSARAYIGIWKKIAMFSVVAFAQLVDRELFRTHHLSPAIALAFTSVEGISICENLVAAGVPVPAALKEFFANTKKMEVRDG